MKRSRIAIAFQLVIVLIIIFVLNQSLNSLFLAVAIVLIIIFFVLFNLKKEVEYFAYLDEDIWTLKFKNDEVFYRVELVEIVDHQLYVIVYLRSDRPKSFIIWLDQLNIQQWKEIKKRSILK